MSKCKGCGKPITWGIDPEGKRIPLDPSAPVYAYASETQQCERTGLALVSHFATCPDANKFSKENRVAAKRWKELRKRLEEEGDAGAIALMDAIDKEICNV